MDVVARFWREVSTPVADLPTEVLLETALGALLLVAVRPVWRRTRHVVTIAHEGAHGLAAVLSGRRLAGIRLHSDTSGLTVSAGRPTGPGMVLTLLAGYTGPGLFGLARRPCWPPVTPSACSGRCSRCWRCCSCRSATGTACGRCS